MDYERFPLLKLAYEVGKQGGIMPTVMNAANEAAVHLFLKKKISFLEIEDIVFKYVEIQEQIKNPTLKQIIEIDQKIQQEIYQAYEKR
jgi:1-deoxy-D-xylulose-5-phosphate reductoisomerase